MNQILMYAGGAVAMIGGFLGWVYLDEEQTERSFQFESSYSEEMLPDEVVVQNSPKKKEKKRPVSAKPQKKKKQITPKKKVIPKKPAKPVAKKPEPEPQPAQIPEKPVQQPETPIIEEEEVFVKSKEELEAEAIAKVLKSSQKQAFDETVVLTSLSASSESSQSATKETDKNKAEDWNVDKDENTYPFDLTRVITKEKFIPAITRNRIVSKLAGKALLLITRNVYGSHGNLVLIPAGSQASGYYKPLAKVGDDRLSLVIERVVKPNGDLILFRKTSLGADASGATGVPGDVDNHYFEKFGIPLMFSTLNSASNAALRQFIANNSSQAGREIFDGQWQQEQRQTNSQVIQEIIRNNINIAPVITIEAGTSLLLFLQNDIFFKPNLNNQTSEAQEVQL